MQGLLFSEHILAHLLEVVAVGSVYLCSQHHDRSDQTHQKKLLRATSARSSSRNIFDIQRVVPMAILT